MMTNKGNTVLYTEVSKDLQQRVFDHRTGRSKIAFTWRYQCWKLVDWEEFNDIELAIACEKQLKNWKRAWKDELIGKYNPDWKDVSADWDYFAWLDPQRPTSRILSASVQRKLASTFSRFRVKPGMTTHTINE
ncbi:MAG: GIY-YIG nuclease family protein [Flavobacteriales bacterium]